MELTGKCKVDFEKWFENLEIPHYYINVELKTLPQSMQYGVYVDFFDSVGLKLMINYSEGLAIGSKIGFYYTIDYRSYGSSKSTRQEARTEAIKKANEIYNYAK